jgi:hypothetical protein
MMYAQFDSCFSFFILFMLLVNTNLKKSHESSKVQSEPEVETY